MDRFGTLLRRILFMMFICAGLVFAPSAAEARDIDWAGIRWGLRQTAGPVDPGPNTFSNAEDQVWVDELGRVHLTIQNRGGFWAASELMAKVDAEYGRYSFDLGPSILDFDPSIVFGFFTWDKNSGEANREIDIELSRWGDPDGKFGWFTLQPYDRPGNQHSFDLPKASRYTFALEWRPGSLTFECSADGALAARWSRSGDDVPDPGRARLRINLWLFRGAAPAGPGPYEAVLSNFSYEALK